MKGTYIRLNVLKRTSLYVAIALLGRGLAVEGFFVKKRSKSYEIVGEIRMVSYVTPPALWRNATSGGFTVEARIVLRKLVELIRANRYNIARNAASAVRGGFGQEYRISGKGEPRRSRKSGKAGAGACQSTVYDVPMGIRYSYRRGVYKYE